MIKLLNKEMRLAASPLSYLFIAFALITFVPGYPILVGTFFCCLGIFQSFQAARESNDMLYTALLPIAKSDVVRARYAFCVCIELCFFVIAAAATLIRMTVLADAPAYQTKVLMPANFVYLGFVLLIFGCFNSIFVSGFFRTAYKFGKPFVAFIVTSFLIVGIAETLMHIPFCTALGTPDFRHLIVQLVCFVSGCMTSILLTIFSMQKSIRYFEKIDL